MTTQSTSLRLATIIAITYRKKIAAYQSRFVRTKGGFVICSKCCYTERDKFAVDNLWLIVKEVVNKSDRYLFCDHCNSRIEVLKRDTFSKISNQALPQQS